MFYKKSCKKYTNKIFCSLQKNPLNHIKLLHNYFCDPKRNQRIKIKSIATQNRSLYLRTIRPRDEKNLQKPCNLISV